MSTRRGSEPAARPLRVAEADRKPVSAVYQTDWGEGAVTVCEGRLIAVDVPVDRAQNVTAVDLDSLHVDDRAALRRWVTELEAYFRGERLCWSAGEVALDELGLPGFVRDVYAALLEVPAAETVSYGALAEQAGYPRAARAVGNAMASNPIPIVVPCHRVIKADGSYGNYGSDPAYKVLLLDHERACVAPRENG